VDFTKAMKLAFLLTAGQGDSQEYKGGFEVLAEDGRSILHEPHPLFFRPVGPRTYIMLTDIIARFPGPGRYRLRLTINGSTHFEGWFELFKAAVRTTGS
jgi:hypothetical protein